MIIRKCNRENEVGSQKLAVLQKASSGKAYELLQKRITTLKTVRVFKK